MSWEEWTFFMVIWIAASLPLGPNALNCVATSATYGFRTGLWSVLGVTIASIIHMSVALTGIATFMNANPILFDLLRWCGVAYLVWMGMTLLRQRTRLTIDTDESGASAGQLVRRAIVISLSNPKAIFTWMAIFTQFVSHSVPLHEQLIVLAPSALVVTLLTYAGYCTLGLGVNRLFKGNRKRWFDRITGTSYIGFATILAFSDLRRA